MASEPAAELLEAVGREQGADHDARDGKRKIESH
jgi:hypothetical protein